MGTFFSTWTFPGSRAYYGNVISRIQLEQFRNYPTLDFELASDARTVVLFGDNAQGKTNLLEAIFLITITKSFRTNALQDLIQEGKKFLRVRLTMAGEDADTREYELFYESGPRQHRSLKINGVKAKTSDFAGAVKAVLFTPDDITLPHASPQKRRRYMDILLMQMTKGYLGHLINYRKALKQRNKVLSDLKGGYGARIGTDKVLKVWDESLIGSGSVLIEARKQLIESIRPKLKAHHADIADSPQEVDIKYLASVSGKDAFRKRLAESLGKDIAQECTTAGPHRDDMLLTLDHKIAAKFCSRGEIKSIVMALKVAEANLLEEQAGRPPLLLLDEIFAELDAKRRKKLLQLIKGHQSIMTGVEEEYLKELKNALVFEVSKGTIHEA